MSFFVGMARAVVKSTIIHAWPPEKCGGIARVQPAILIVPSARLLVSFTGFFAGLGWSGDGSRRASRSANAAATTSSSSSAATSEVPAPLTPQRRPRLHCPSRHSASRNNNHPGISGGGLTHHDRRHNCSRCGKSYKNAYILKRHMLYECGKAPSFSCPHCAFSSKYERNLKAHINHRHVDLQPALPGIAVGQRETRHQHGRE
ncbi:Longitudinals lacking protein, isoform G [Camponotus floridanus]|uniref:Longitudinals lacking protein, isoform G n=1 Tax=Camponotus floridanus TaxID=104421 RepID=E2AEU0_CAMFO|nr:Longitudinals lacking protein, isoform G [Camponotus floridanus]